MVDEFLSALCFVCFNLQQKLIFSLVDSLVRNLDNPNCVLLMCRASCMCVPRTKGCWSLSPEVDSRSSHKTSEILFFYTNLSLMSKIQYCTVHKHTNYILSYPQKYIIRISNPVYTPFTLSIRNQTPTNKIVRKCSREKSFGYIYFLSDRNAGVYRPCGVGKHAEVSFTEKVTIERNTETRFTEDKLRFESRGGTAKEAPTETQDGEKKNTWRSGAGQLQALPQEAGQGGGGERAGESRD